MTSNPDGLSSKPMRCRRGISTCDDVKKRSGFWWPLFYMRCTAIPRTSAAADSTGDGPFPAADNGAVGCPVCHGPNAPDLKNGTPTFLHAMARHNDGFRLRAVRLDEPCRSSVPRGSQQESAFLRWYDGPALQRSSFGGASGLQGFHQKSAVGFSE